MLTIAIGLIACKDHDDGSHTGTDTQVDPIPAFAEAGGNPLAAMMSAGGTGPDDVWLVGATPVFNGPPLVLHRTGGDFEEVVLPTLHDVWWVHAFPGGPTFFAGGGATVIRGEGGVYERLDTPGFAGQTVYGLWGAAPDDVWAVGGFAGRAGFAWRWDGSTWTDVDLPADLPRADDGEIPALFKVWGRSSDDVYLVGGVGTVLHWDGAALSVVPTGTREQLFTVHGDASQVLVVGGGSEGVALEGDAGGFTDETPTGAPLLQALHVDGDGTVWTAGAGGNAWRRTRGAADWAFVDLGFAAEPPSVHALWSDGTDLWAVGGGVLTPALDAGVIATTDLDQAPYVAPEIPPVSTVCPATDVDPFPTGSIARRWNEQLLNSVRRDIPNPPVHARNLHHVSVAMFDAWAAYQDTADGVVYRDRETADDLDAAREVAISYAAYRVLVQRYTHAQNAALTLDCYAQFMDTLGLDPADTHTDGGDAIAVGNRVGQAVIDRFLDDGSNEANLYADTTEWTPSAPVLVVDHVGTPATDPDVWQQLNLATAETQNGIVLDTSVQPYIGAHWREVEPFAATRDPVTGLYSAVTEDDYPTVADPTMVDDVVEVIRKTAELDHLDGEMIDIGPNATGDNALGENDGSGYRKNPVTGAPYAPNLVPRGDATRVIAEMWADGPKSETPPGHWAKLANEVSDELSADQLVPWGEGEPVDRLAWDVGIYLAVTGATHDAAIAAWEVKREAIASRPITLIRWMAQQGQSSDSSLPSYSPDGLPLVDGLIELITEASSAPGQRHHHLRWYVGELAVWSWPGEPGDRANTSTELRWMRALDWIPYQRRTFVTPAFPGFISGHSTFSRAAAEALTAYTASPWFPGGVHEFVAPANGYLVFEDGPSVEVKLQWASYYDAADQAGQSRLWGGIHIWPDDRIGRITGSKIGIRAATLARGYWDGVVVP
ncbi:MAG: vanadium-dependent haloperoxidase [Myxococcota bacterium]